MFRNDDTHLSGHNKPQRGMYTIAISTNATTLSTSVIPATMGTDRPSREVLDRWSGFGNDGGMPSPADGAVSPSAGSVSEPR